MINPELNLLLFSLVAIIPFGIVTSYNDIKRNKIKNKWILRALIAAFILNLFVYLYILDSTPASSGIFVKEFFLNILFAFLVGIMIWEGSLWSAGDAKLFLAYAVLVPLTVYKWGYIANFPSSVILINTFTPYFIYYFGYILLKSSLRDKLSVFKQMFMPKNLFNFAVFIFGFGWLVNLLFGLLNYQANFYVTVFVLFLLMVPLSKTPKIGLLGSGIILSVLRLIFDPTVFTIFFLQQFLLIFLLFVFARYFVINLGFNFFATPMFIEDLEPGMILAEDIVEIKGGYIKRKNVPISFITTLFDKFQYKSLISHMPEGLTKQDVEKINRLHSEGKFKPHEIAIYHTVPFAPFMFAGVLITIIAEGNVLMVLRVVLENFI